MKEMSQLMVKHTNYKAFYGFGNNESLEFEGTYHCPRHNWTDF